MADTPLTTEQLKEREEALGRVENASRAFQNSLISETNILSNVESIMGKLSQRFTQAGSDIKNLNSLTKEQADAFNLLTLSTVKVRESFANLVPNNTGLNTFGQQVSDIQKMLTNVPAGKAAEALTIFTQAAEKLGIGKNAIAEAAKKGASAVGDLIKNSLAAADNGLRMQQVIFSTAAAQGRLNDLYTKAGTNLEHLNDIMRNEAAVLDAVSKSTHVSGDELDKYWASFKSLPGAVSGAAGSMDTFTQSINYAKGAGIDHTVVMGNMKKAIASYGLAQKDALLFTARIGEVSNNLKAPYEDVANALNTAAEQFKLFGNSGEAALKQTEGLSKFVNQFASGLVQTGMSATNALSSVNQMTGALSNMNVAQKAFLSQTGGGPGGLRGAVQIDKMLREGKIEEVIKMQMQSMQRQLGGRIISQDEATKSEAAAAQFQKQQMIIKQGPLGGLAKTDAEAVRISEVMRDMQAGKSVNAKELLPDIVSKMADRGQQRTQLSTNDVTMLRDMLQGITYNVNISALSAVQRGAIPGFETARSGDRTTEDSPVRRRLMDEERAARAQARTTANVVASGGQITHEQSVLTGLKGLVTRAEGVSQVAETTASRIFNAVQSKNDQEIKNITQEIEAKKMAAKSLSGADQQKMLFEANQQQQVVNQATDIMQPSVSPPPPKPKFPPLTNTEGEEFNPNTPVVDATKRQVTVAPTQTNPALAAGGGTTRAPQPQAVAASAGPQQVQVHVTGYCLKCKQDIERSTQHPSATNTAGTT